ncbi:antirepressor [Marinitoga sp. 1197]|uniref:BRO family protein n=1 Tax=Marinitoga sp. 1197 TaxID=1428449 RepID=UPI00065876DD|nr:BRO family protein [Marinitoga sp. 1197]AJW76933.1 antirepressor protein [Marinitoga camini virus 1]KLO24007.1 antirepressor [Marinitoga sp. 1197]
MANLVKFNFKSNEVRVLLRDGEPWWVGKDVAAILGYTDTEAMTRRLDGDEQMLINSKNLQNVGFEIPTRGLKIINESGLYNAILGSKKTQAKEFKRWITHEVLPSIRKYGKYEIENKKTEIEKLSKIKDVISLRKQRENRLRALQLQKFLKENENLDEFTKKTIESEILKLLTNKRIIPLPPYNKKLSNKLLVDDDKMEPTYKKGDIVYYEKKEYEPGNDVVIYYKNKKVLKRCARNRFDGRIFFYNIQPTINGIEEVWENECTVLGVVTSVQREIFKKELKNDIKIKKFEEA